MAHYECFFEFRRRAFYLMAIHENLTRISKPRLQKWAGERRPS